MNSCIQWRLTPPQQMWEINPPPVLPFPPLPSPFPSPSFSLPSLFPLFLSPLPPYPSFPFPGGPFPLVAARGSGGALKLPQRVRAEPGRQTYSGAF